MQFVPVLVVGFAAALGLTPVARQLAFRLGVVDKPSARKIHQDQKPMMGGFAIFMAFTLALLLFASATQVRELAALLGGATLLAIVGLIDDRYGLGIRAKLVAQSIAALAVMAVGIQVHLFKVPLLDYGLTLLWILTVTNAVNFLDNMDGLAAGLASIAAGWFLVIGFTEGLPFVSALAAALLGSAIGFLAFNFNPASTFMGDMGSLVLGFVLAVLGILIKFVDQPLNVTWMVPLLVLALPLFDIHLVVFTRLSEGRSPGEAGKDHTSHRLISLGFSQRQTLFTLYSACLFFGALGVLVGAAPTGAAWRVGVAGLVLLGAAFIAMMIVRRRVQLGRA